MPKQLKYQNRVVDFWNDVKGRNDENIIICSHGDPLYLLYAKLAKIPTPDIKEIYDISDDEYQPKASILFGYLLLHAFD